MRVLTLSLFVLIATSQSLGNVQDLERRVHQLEGKMENLESLVLNVVEKELVGPYGMVKRCPIPRVEHGTVTCDKIKETTNKDWRVPGTVCSAKCEPRYFTTPQVECSSDGSSWSGELRCDKLKEILIVSGGTNTDRSVEVINLHKNSSGCDLRIPNLRKHSNNEVRIMHNMFLNPTDSSGQPQLELWVCNGLSGSKNADCDSWRPGRSQWEHHSYPNMGRGEDPRYNKAKGGRYGAGSFSWNGENYIVGGVVNIGSQHKHSKDIRFYTEGWRTYYGSDWLTYWKDTNSFSMNTKRTLFCIAQLNMSTPSYIAIGGHSGIIEKSAEFLQGDKTIPDMTTPREGHSCVGIEGEEQILVSGGSDKPHQSGGKALKTAEMYNGGTKRWERVGDMNQERFGHALVDIGGRIIAVGGKEWNPDKPLKNAEEFDQITKTWSSIGDVMEVPRANFGYIMVPYSLIPGCTVY